jgi:hypothetical protein
MTKRLVFLVGCVLMVGFSMSSPGRAQCSGRCLIHPQTLEPYCSLSLFGQVICFEGVDYCAEFACPDGLAAGLSLAQPGFCQQASTPWLPGTIKVVELKART